MKLPIAEWLYKWLNENPEASIEDGLKAYQLHKKMDENSFIISDKEIENEIKKRYETTQNDAGFRDGVYWCLERFNNLKLK